jgi:hypothetical protein
MRHCLEIRGNHTVFNESFTTGTLKKIRCAGKEERKPDKDIPSTQRIHIETCSRIVAERKHSMPLPMEEISSNITVGSHVLLHLVLDTFAYSFEVSLDCGIHCGLGFLSFHLCSRSVILWRRPLSNFIQDIIIFV